MTHREKFIEQLRTMPAEQFVELFDKGKIYYGFDCYTIKPEDCTGHVCSDCVAKWLDKEEAEDGNI